MIEIKDLLGRFNNILLSGGEEREAVRKVISEVINIEVKPEEIKIKNNVIYLNIKPIYKNEVFLKHDIIFLQLKEILNKKTPKEIR